MCEKSPLYDFNTNLLGVIMHWIDITNHKIIDCSQFFPNATNKIEKKGIVYTLDDGEINDYKLSERQLECLFYFLKGKSAKEIGSILSLSPRTVESYLYEVKIKMACLTNKEMREKCFMEGLNNVVPKSFLKF